jgi:diguanylate cyclase (GGDEF)-like protein/PAS domain S-box-containing protein
MRGPLRGWILDMHRFSPSEPSLDGLFYRRLLDAATEVVVAQLDLEGRIAYVSGASRWVLGYDPEEMLGRHFGEFIPSKEFDKATEKFEKARSGRPHFRHVVLMRRGDGGEAHIRMDATPLIGSAGDVEGIVLVGHEVTDELVPPAPGGTIEAEAQGGELVERLPAISYVAEPGAEGRWRYVSPQIEGLLGYPRQEWLADPGLWARCIHPEDRTRVIEEEEREAESEGAVGTEYRMLARDGHVVWVRDEAVLRSDPDGSPRYDGILTDVTERKRAESKLRFHADHDHLTGVFNRRRFLEELANEILRLRRLGHPVALLMLDLDSLKDVNDSLGHAVGDALIRATAEILTERVRGTDTVGRLGGDEFAVLLRGASSEHAIGVATELVAAIRERAEAVTGERIPATASAGVAPLRPADGPDDVLAGADRAMYEAKRKGGDRVETYSPEMSRR